MNEGLITNRLCYILFGLLIGLGLGFYLSPTPQQNYSEDPKYINKLKQIV